MYWSRDSERDLFGVLHKNMSYNTARPTMSRILTVLTPHQRLAAGAAVGKGTLIACLGLLGVLKDGKILLIVVVVPVFVLIVCEVLVVPFMEDEAELVVLVVYEVLVLVFREVNEVLVVLVVRVVL